MGRYDFDRIIERKGTSCLKYDFAKARLGRDDLLPMWVADMDFALPEEILSPIKERVDHGIFGYTEPDDEYYEVLEKWFSDHYGWEIKRSWNTVTPGVVYALAVAVKAFTNEGDAVLIQKSVYYPFQEVIEDNDRKCVSNDLKEVNGRYEIDFEDLETKIVSENVKLFILCSPHNPVGRVWSEEELKKMGDICLRHGVIVAADEIHCDFILTERDFTSYARLGEKYTSSAIICTSPSKTFNMAGLQVANIIIPDEKLRRVFRKANAASGYSQGNILGLTAAKAAYNNGGEWLKELLEYLKGNIDYFRGFLKENIPEARLIEPEGTYLLWVDFSQLVQDPVVLKKLIRDEAKLWLDDGDIFGKKTALFERFNIACPRSTVEEALHRLKSAVDSFKEKGKE